MCTPPTRRRIRKVVHKPATERVSELIEKRIIEINKYEEKRRD